MSSHPHNKFSAADLDPDLLAAPFRVQTNWHVITGAPCSGKTTLIEQLADLGYQIVAETARPYIEREIAKGRTLEEIFSCKADAPRMKNLQLRTEHELYANDLLFLDRALPDCLAFWPLYDLDPNEFLAECFHHQYASVFILDRLPIQLDGVRLDDNPMADYLDLCHARDYSALGYPVTRIPVLPPPKRLIFILDAVSEPLSADC